MQELALGFLAAAGAMIFFGSYAVPMKTPAVLGAKMDPIIFQSYKSFMCFATSSLVLLYTPLKFTWWGMLGALIWVINGASAVLAVQLVGIGLAQSLWSSLSIIVSYIWGAYIFKETVQNHELSLLSVFVMVGGMLGVGFIVGKQIEKDPAIQYDVAYADSLNTLGSSLLEIEKDPAIQYDVAYVDSLNTLDSSLLVKDLNVPKGNNEEDASQGQMHRLDLLKGIGLATLVGVLNGSFLIPLKYAHKDVVGVEYLVSFGVGSMAMTIVVLGVYWCSCKLSGHSFPSFKIKEGAGPALLTGLLWSIGNFLSIYATLYLGLSLGWPLVQCQLLVSACWAVFYYKEVSSNIAAIIVVASSLVVVGGAVMLSYFGTVA